MPKPFEIGALGSVVERFTEMIMAGDDYQARDFRSTALNIFLEQLQMNPIPQIFKPGFEAFFNYDMYRERPIDSMADMHLLPQYRYKANTSAAAPSETSEQSDRFKGPATRGFFSDSLRQKSNPKSRRMWA